MRYFSKFSRFLLMLCLGASVCSCGSATDINNSSTNASEQPIDNADDAVEISTIPTYKLYFDVSVEASEENLSSHIITLYLDGNAFHRFSWSNEYRVLKLQQFIRGWVNYFKLADMKSLLQDTDEWLRHRIRAIYWKQWKKVRTRIRKLRSLNLPEWVV